MKRILLTGMSGTGKSTVLVALAARGYQTVDMDDPGWSVYDPDGDWVWCAERLHARLAHQEGQALFISGCASNQGQFYPQFDRIILLSAPVEVIVERLATRTNNPYGKHPDELAATLHNLETIEPLLRKGAGHEIDTSAPLEQVVAQVLQILYQPSR